MSGLWNIKHFPLYSHTMIVVGPEHARTFGDEGWSRADLTRYLFETVRVPYGTLLPDSDNGEGTNLRFSKGEAPALDELDPQIPSMAEHARGGGGRNGWTLLHGRPGLARDAKRLGSDHASPSERFLDSDRLVGYASRRLWVHPVVGYVASTDSLDSKSTPRGPQVQRRFCLPSDPGGLPAMVVGYH